MAQAFQFQTHVGTDGILTLRLPLGPGDADKDVIVTVQPIDHSVAGGLVAQGDRSQAVRNTYGACAGLGLEEPKDMPPQESDWPE